MASLKSMMPSRCSVFREGAESKVDATELVPGDLVRMKERVPTVILSTEENTAESCSVRCSSSVFAGKFAAGGI